VADPLDALPPESRAILKLVLAQGYSYDEISDMLGVDREIVRMRAHAAVEALVTGIPAPPRDVRRRIVDYLLGEQGVAARSRTRAVLAEAPLERAWATLAASALAPVSLTALPTIPAGTEPSPEPRVVPRAEPEPQPPPPPRRRRGPLVAAVIIIVAAGIGALIALSTGGAASPATPVRELTLRAAGPERGVSATATVLRQGDGLVLRLSGRGLAPPPDGSYAVWLVNGNASSKLLGFVSVAGRTFAAWIPLPRDAARFRTLAITREQSSQPVTPGTVVLSGTLMVQATVP
jgi:hypothetical protein